MAIVKNCYQLKNWVSKFKKVRFTGQMLYCLEIITYIALIVTIIIKELIIGAVNYFWVEVYLLQNEVMVNGHNEFI